MRSCDVIRELWEVRCEKWNCDELGCDKLWWVVIRSGPVRSGAVMSWDVISTAPCHAKGSQEALYTAPATRSQPRPSGAHARRSSSRRLYGLRLPRERQAGSCVYCACHTKPAAAQRRPRAPQLLQETLCTAPATRKAARLASRPAPTRAAAVLRLPRERQPGSSLYCACYAKPAHQRPRAPQLLQEALWTGRPKGSQEALYTAPATRSQLRPSGAHARRSSLCTAPATRKAARKLSVLRLPREASRGPAAPTHAAAPPGGSVYCAGHAKGSQERAPQVIDPGGSVYTAPATRKAARKLSVLRLPREVSEWVREGGREGGSEGGREGVREWGSEGVSEWGHEWGSDGVREWRSEGVRERGTGGVREWRSEGAREWGSEGVMEWGSEGVREWGSEGVREWGSEGVREGGSDECEWGGGSGGGGGGGAEPRRDPSEKQEPHTVMWGTTHTHNNNSSHTTLSHNFLTHNSLTHTQLSHTTLSQHTTTLSQLFHTHNLLTHTTAILSHTSKLRPPICVAGMALGDIDHHSMWQARHLFHSILCGSCGVWWHQPSFCVVPLRRGCLCGRRGIWKHRPPFCVAGVALGDIDHRPGTWRHQHRGALGSCWRRGCLCGRRSIDLHSVWRGVWWHQPSFCGSRGAYFTGLALVARLVPVGAAAVCVAGVAFGSIDLHSVWQAWHLATSDFTLCGNWRQVWQFRARSCGIAVHFVWEIKSKRSKVDVVAFTDIEFCATFPLNCWPWAAMVCCVLLRHWMSVHHAALTELRSLRVAATLCLTGCRCLVVTSVCLSPWLVMTCRCRVPFRRYRARAPVATWQVVAATRVRKSDPLPAADTCDGPSVFMTVRAAVCLQQSFCSQDQELPRPLSMVLAQLSLATHTTQRFHTQFFHTQLSHTQHSHTISLPPSPPYSHTLFLTLTQLSHTTFPQTQLSHTQLSHTQLTPTALSHTTIRTSFTQSVFHHLYATHTHTFSHTTCSHTQPSHKKISYTQLSQTYLFHTFCLPPYPQNSHILFQIHSVNPSHTQPSHTELPHSICLPPSPFSFLPFPSRLHLSCATYWKKLTCGVIRPFDFSSFFYGYSFVCLCVCVCTIWIDVKLL